MRRARSHRRPGPSAGKAAALIALTLVLALAAGAYTYQIAYDGRVYHGVSAMGVDLGGYTVEEARAALNSSYASFQKSRITLKYQNHTWRALPEELGIDVDTHGAAEIAYDWGRSGDVLSRLADQLTSFRHGHAIRSRMVSVDRARLKEYLSEIASEVQLAPIDADVHIGQNQQIVILKSKPGQRLNVDATVTRIEQSVEMSDPRGKSSALSVIDVVVDEVPPLLQESALAETVSIAERMLSTPITLKAADQTLAVSPDQIRGWMSFKVDQGGSSRQARIVLDDTAIAKKVQEIAASVDYPARNARFSYAGGVLESISDGTNGRQIDVESSVARVKTALETGEESVDLPIVAVRPDVGPEDGAKLAIEDLIDQASTRYDVGTSERRYNVELAASRLNGVVVGPGETFSFNEEVGEVSYRNGYKQGYGITQGSDGQIQTIPSEGGGICQVATTLFHAVFWSGYQVVERNWHLYWIPRYGLPPRGLTGLDATIDQIYDADGNLTSAVDLQFKNNTEDYVLIQALTDDKNLTFRLYGTTPDWEVKVDKPKIDNVVKTDPAPVRQLDPKMAPGSEMMIESAQDGFRASIMRTVTRDGKVVEQKSFISTYRPSRNVYSHGPEIKTPTPTPTKPATSTPTEGTPPADGTALPSASPGPAQSPKPTAAQPSQSQPTPAPQ